MRKFILAACLLIASATAVAQEYVRYGTSIALQGWLITAYGEPPDGGDVAIPALQLIRPITVLGIPNEAPTQPNVVLMQMALSDKYMAKYATLKGKRVTVRGTLFPQINGHHYTSVLITVSSITQSK